MQKFKKALSVLLTVVMLMSSMVVVSFADGGYDPTFTSGNFIYKQCRLDDGIEVVGYTDSSAKTISIPKQLNGHTVVGIGRHYEPKEGEYAFGSLKNLTSVSIPDSVTIIDSSAFSGCAGLTSITIPNSVTCIYPNAFNSCTSLTNITIPNSVKKIDEWAFAGCTKLTSITISDSVTDISYSAFDETGYYNNEANWKDDVLYIGNVLLQAKPTITGTYSIKSGTKVIAGHAFGNCKSLTGIIIPDSVVSIGYSAFWYCENLSSVIIPNGVTSINNNTFRGCTRLISVTIPNSVTSVGYNAFEDTGYYNNEANWQNGVLYIGNYLIKADEVSGSYSVKSGTKTIAEDAFYYCEDLVSVTLPDGLLYINTSAFDGCESLTSITIPESVKNISESAFCNTGYYNNNANWQNGALYIGNHLIEAGGVSGSYSVKAGTKTIADSAFAFCDELTSITLPDSIKIIGDSAFCYCKNIKDVYYSGTSEQWNKITICENNECLTDANIHFAGSPQVHTHSYTSVVVKPTCTEKGYTEYTCSSCHYSYKDNYVDAAGHKWGEWVRTTEPTMDSTGVETRECSVCHNKETKTIEKLTVLVDNTTGVKIGFEDEFEAGTDIKVTEVFDGQSLQVISNNFGDVKTKIFDITPEKDGVKVQPNGKVTIRIPIPDGFNANKIFVVYVDSVSGKTTTLPTKVVGNYIEFETDHFSQYALVERKGQVKSVSLNNLELQYKSSAKLNPVIEADSGVKYKVEYKSSNTNVVTVDNNGNIYGAKKGNATITCIVTDEYGNTVQNTCNVNVKYVWWQWIIKIVLFGWIWY